VKKEDQAAMLALKELDSGEIMEEGEKERISIDVGFLG
jgi:hypothetical protein